MKYSIVIAMILGSLVIRCDVIAAEQEQLLSRNATYQIDAVNVWMPGGQGATTGHLHDLMLAVSPTAEGTDWQMPVDRVTNPYWPMDNAPKPYVIPISDLDVVGHRVRVTATLSGSGGMTRRLAMTEVEVWGQETDQVPTLSASLQLRPIAVDPEPVGELHPQLKWMQEQKVRALWIGGNVFEKFSGTDKTKAQVIVDAGFNLVVLYTGVDRKNRDVAPDLEDRLARNLAEAQRHGLKVMTKWQYGSTHQEPYRKYRAPNGRLAKQSCCPLDEQYIERHIGRWAVASARGGADGMVIDTEMYESDQTGYPGSCVCDDCFATYLQAFVDGDWQLLFKQVAPERRGLWLTANSATEHYGRFLAKRIEIQYDKIRQRCQEINLAFLFAHAPFLGHMLGAGLERGLGTSSVPCLVFSEREYNNGPSSESFANVKRIRQQGIPALYLPGAFLVPQNPQMVEQNGLIGTLYCDGWWLYYASAILNHPAADDPKAFNRKYGRVKGTSAWDYLGRITTMHQELERLLADPKLDWPKPKQLPPPPSANVPPRKGIIKIDGQLDERAWDHALRLDIAQDRPKLGR